MGHEKVGLVGRNGVGKTTLLRILAHDLEPSSGEVETCVACAWVPQVLVYDENMSIAEILQIDEVLTLLSKAESGHMTKYR